MERYSIKLLLTCLAGLATIRLDDVLLAYFDHSLIVRMGEADCLELPSSSRAEGLRWIFQNDRNKKKIIAMNAADQFSEEALQFEVFVDPATKRLTNTKPQKALRLETSDSISFLDYLTSAGKKNANSACPGEAEAWSGCYVPEGGRYLTKWLEINIAPTYLKPYILCLWRRTAFKNPDGLIFTLAAYNSSLVGFNPYGMTGEGIVVTGGTRFYTSIFCKVQPRDP